MPDIQRTRKEPDVEVVAVSGKIILGRECQRVEWLIDELIRDGQKKVVFDLSGLTHIDSTGVGIIVTCCGRMTAAGGELRLAALQPRILEILHIAKLDRVLSFYPSAETAAERF